MDIVRVPIKSYIHVMDLTTNITELIEGPRNYALQSNEVVVKQITPFIQLTNNTYITIRNPVVKSKDNVVELENFGLVKVNWGEIEIRTYNDYKDPFPLYPGEEVVDGIKKFINLLANEQTRMKALRDFTDEDGVYHKAGSMWTIKGPANLLPRCECEIVKNEILKATIITNNSAIQIKATRDTIDSKGISRKAGDQWLIRESGAYFPSVYEEIVQVKTPKTLTDKVALHLRAEKNFKDIYGNERKAGEEWLVTNEMTELHIIDAYETLVNEVKITVLTSRQYCVIQNPFINGKINYGKRVLKRGETSFFIRPGEILENNKVNNILVLDENDALLLEAIEPYNDGKIDYVPGNKWVLRGPREFCLPLELIILKQIKAIPLDENEGIYIRNLSNGEVKMITGQTYLLEPNEELYEKELNPIVEQIVNGQKSGTNYVAAEQDEKGNMKYGSNVKPSTREKFRVVTYRSPQNSVCQIFDYKSMKSRTVFGPELIKLGPHEDFTVLNLSGQKPKVENQIVTIPLLLGPDFMTDIIEVETKDHARLSLTLCYSWKFDVTNRSDPAEVDKLFKINDFIGDACKNLAAKIRASVSKIPFEVFHQNSASIVKSAVFGLNENMTTNNFLKFNSNNLVIINVDVNSQEPINSKTRENLSKSTNLSIQSQNYMQQAETEHRQRIITEENRGKLQLQIIEDNTKSEKQNIEFLKKKIETEVVKSTGELKAKAFATSKTYEIEGNALLLQSKMNVESKEIELMSQENQEEMNIKEDIRKREELLDMELKRLQLLSEIEVMEFEKTVKAFGKKTIVEMARSGPEVQAKLLKSLGIKSFLITDGKNPINLFSTAKQVIKDTENS